jgi:hypothetical protein
MIEHDSGTAFGNSFEIQALSSLQTPCNPQKSTCQNTEHHVMGIEQIK